MTQISDPEEALRDVHEKFLEFIQAWDNVVELTLDGRFRASVEAYQPFVRDQGMGDDPFDWMQAAAEELGFELKWGGFDQYDQDKWTLKSVEPLTEDPDEDD